MIMQNKTTGTSLETITPAIATQYLKLNRHNRKLSNRTAERLEQAMKDLNWKTNGETIKFGTGLEGKEILLDGQHRLTACVTANVPFSTYVIRGLDPDVFDTIDSGKKRNLADVYSTMGCKSTTMLACSIVLVDRYTIGKLAHHNSSDYPNEVAQTLIDLYPEIITSVNLIERLKKTLPLAPGAVAAAHYIFAQIDVEEADAFAVKLSKGIGLTEHCPIRHFREQMIKDRARKNPWTRFELLGTIIKVWNHVRFARSMTRSATRWTPDTAPQPVAK
tara:strand:+ start:996 stop:1823 length:828 start_codon:yes stop_codon:yes gene_type:complete